jgi:hypothetical protein
LYSRNQPFSSSRNLENRFNWRIEFQPKRVKANQEILSASTAAAAAAAAAAATFHSKGGERGAFIPANYQGKASGISNFLVYSHKAGNCMCAGTQL